MASDYTKINPDDFEVRTVINVINQNLEYIYGKQEDNKQTVTNLVPYADFSVISNIDYWKPYQDSVISITDNQICSFSRGSLTGVITPALATPIVAGEDYTLIVKCRSNIPNTLLNELYLVDEYDNKYRVNHDQVIPNKAAGTLTLTFNPSIGIQNPRLIIGSSDVYQESREIFEYRDRILDSTFVKDDLILPYIDMHKAVYDSYTIPLKTSIYFLLANYDYDVYNKINSLKSGGIVGTSYNTKTGEVRVITEKEHYLFCLLNIRLASKDISFKDRAIESLNFLASRYNECPIKGLFPIREGSSEYSLYLSSIVYEAIEIYSNAYGHYSGQDDNGHSYSTNNILEDIKSYVLSMPSTVYSFKYIKGGLRGDTEFYIDSDGGLSSSEIDIVTQLELYKLLLKCDLDIDFNKNLKSLMSYEFKGFLDTYLMLDKVRPSDIIIQNSILTIDAAVLYLNILRHYPGKFLEADIIVDEIMSSLMSLRSLEGYYKYDYSLGGYTFSSNQYLELFLEGLEYPVPRTLYLEEIALFKGKGSENVSVINTSGGSISRVEYSMERVTSDISTLDNSIYEMQEDIIGLEYVTRDENIINVCSSNFYSKSEMDTKTEELTNQNKSLVEENKSLTDRIKAVEEASAEYKTKIEALEKSSTEYKTKIEALEKSSAEYKTKIEALEKSLADVITRLTALENK